MKKKLKGSALLWAVCALLIVVFVLTGLLALNKTYAEEEINNIAARRAEYLARSGIELTADMIINNNNSNKLGVDLKDIDKKFEDDDPTKALKSEVKLSIEFELDCPVKVEIERTSGDTLKLSSTATSGYMTREVTAIMKRTGNGTNETWVMKGYATN
ncbi:MAG: hypothetical protein IKH50_08595 [Oscillospiraceae bacterium]|nr:hypothetical protein [Oscillospiraceae bacterium]